MTFEDSGTGRELKKPIPEIREREGNGKNPFPKFGNGKGMKKSIPKIREREGNEKNPFPKFGNGKGMKKIHSRNSGRESEAFILGNDREREFPLTPDWFSKYKGYIMEKQRIKWKRMMCQSCHYDVRITHTLHQYSQAFAHFYRTLTHIWKQFFKGK